MKAKMAFKCGAVVGLLLFFWGCSVTLPNIEPFAVETRKMVSAVEHGYTHAETLLSMVEEPDEPSGTVQNEKQKAMSEKAEAVWKSSSSNENPFEKLENNWELMKKVLNALVIYSDELAALADAGTKGEEAAQGLSNALNGIIGTITNGALFIPEKLAKAFGKINDTLAKVRARKALKKAVEEAQPVINIIVKIIFHNLEDLEKINNSAGWVLRTLHRKKNKSMTNYYKALMESQQTIFLILTDIHNYKKYKASDAPRAREYLKDVVKLDNMLAVIGEENITIKDIEAREKYWLMQHQKIKGEIKYLSPRYQAYKAREDEINTLTSTGSLILRKGKSAILEYGKAHMKLKKAFGKKQRTSFVEFASVVQDVADVYKGGK